MRRALLVGALCIALAGCGATTPNDPERIPADLPTQAATTPQVADPARVLIPKLGVDDNLVPVGICRGYSEMCPDGPGGMELPPVEDTGWYRPGPEPGEPGPAVLAGHVNWKGRPGALGRIGELEPGDLVTVVDVHGIHRTFVVDTVQQIPKTDYWSRTVPAVFGPTPGPELRLVTCSGQVVDGNYSDNTVVSAHLLT
ncbi:Sortase family protein [Pseudonocardia thermophila]|jgi:Sortase (surface protein transpeptidase)|uniref:Sortase family protein n=1 Tax=Pseudonocardia thermophila TaxID=1848 RepID=A0A1M7AHW8_PSETH|nr:class F sortase [Pseudonocardia thermophila]SHL42176.1 Sortase family protein [Pseudonocardia thermophila]